MNIKKKQSISITSIIKHSCITLFFLILLQILIQCSHKNTINDSHTLEIDEGILALNVEYLEGTSTFESITLIIQSWNSTKFLKIKLNQNTAQTFLLRLKQGFYSFADILAKSNLNYQGNNNRNQKSTLFQGQFHENLFQVKAQQINYIGNVSIQFKRRQIGKIIHLKSLQSHTKKRLYTSINYNLATMQAIKQKYIQLAKLYPLKQEKILFGQGKRKLEARIQNSPGVYSDYGQDNYGHDDQGYKNFKWGMNFKEVKAVLDQENTVYRSNLQANHQANENNDWIMSVSEPVKTYFYFSPLLPLKKGEKYLYKVLIQYKKGSKNWMLELQDKHGKPQEKKEGWVWELPATFIFLKEKKLIELSYLSKKHQKTINLLKKIKKNRDNL